MSPGYIFTDPPRPADEDPWVRAATVDVEVMPENLLTACQEEVQDLWSDLSDARNVALGPNRWSMQCDWITERIVVLSRLAGVTDWERIPTDLLLDGTYEGILATAGLDPGELPSTEELRALHAATTNQTSRLTPPAEQ